MPRRIRSGPRKGELVWGPLEHWRALQLLHNPRYAGAFFFGRFRRRRRADGTTTVESLPRDQWHTLLPDAHEGYIAWEEFETNQRLLREHAQAYGRDRRSSPPREGPALLQGLVLCGKCGDRMTVRYHQRRGVLHPTYVCQRDGIDRALAICQRIPGVEVDQAIGDTLVKMMTPVALEVALAVQQELAARIDEVESVRRQQVERARYEADLARRRYMQVDPDNRLVADSLEAEWNDRLRALAETQEEYERSRAADRCVANPQQRARILALATDFPRLWRDPKTPMRDRKRMVRLLVEDVTLVRAAEIHAHLRLRGGTTHSLVLSRPKRAWELRQTPPEILREMPRWTAILRGSSKAGSSPSACLRDRSRSIVRRRCSVKHRPCRSSPRISDALL